MARRRKKERSQSGAPAPGTAAKPAPTATTSLAPLLKAAGLAKVPERPNAQSAQPAAKPQVRVHVPATQPRPGPRPVAVSPGAELRMLNDAYAGARPLARKSTPAAALPPVARRQVVEADRADEAVARARLAALVAGGVRFKIVDEDEFVQAWRVDASAKLVLRLAGQAFTPEATLDLHGQRAAKVSDLVASFVRAHHRLGVRQLLIIAGKGLHSENGIGVLREAAVDALTKGFAAPLVLAFATAHANRGGSGALAVLLG
jgi:DNA-nicking Smr family endonuclease